MNGLTSVVEELVVIYAFERKSQESVAIVNFRAIPPQRHAVGDSGQPIKRRARLTLLLL